MLPRRDSAAVKLIAESLGCDSRQIIAGGHASHDSRSGDRNETFLSLPSGNGISLDHCMFRPDHEEPASSYIIRSAETGSRTIVNYNELPETTVEELKGLADDIVRGAEVEAAISRGERGGGEGVWLHFEVRPSCCPTLRPCSPSGLA